MTILEQNIMAGVRVIYAVRMLVSGIALKVYAFIASVAGTMALVSVPHVVANFMTVAQGGASSIVMFLFLALIKTKLLVQIAVVLGGMSLVLLARDTMHALSAQHRAVPVLG